MTSGSTPNCEYFSSPATLSPGHRGTSIRHCGRVDAYVMAHPHGFGLFLSFFLPKFVQLQPIPGCRFSWLLCGVPSEPVSSSWTSSFNAQSKPRAVERSRGISKYVSCTVSGRYSQTLSWFGQLSLNEKSGITRATLGIQ